MTTKGKRQWGKRRVTGCQCDAHYTCGPCLANAAVITMDYTTKAIDTPNREMQCETELGEEGEDGGR